MQLRYAARSDVGLVRPGNEDSGYAGPRLLVVADGMGGHAAGELASATAVAMLAELDASPPADPLTAMADVVDRIGSTLVDLVQEDVEVEGMGTTVTGIYWLGERIAIVHVGDSRAYLLRDGELVQLTHDHTYVQTLVDSGQISEEEAATHPRRSLLMRALDGISPVEADLSVREARVGDRLLLCSDGLSGVLTGEEIHTLLATGEPTGCVTRLVDRALEHGAPDNVTVVVADVIDFEVSIEDSQVLPVVVGAAGELRVRERLPRVQFPLDAEPDPEHVAQATERTRAASPENALEVRKREVRKRRWTRTVLALVIVGAVAALALVAGRLWLQTQWFVSVLGNPGTGTVAVYNGVPGSLMGVSLSSVSSDSTIAVGTLPLFDQELVSKGIPAADAADAERIINELAQRATDCISAPTTGCPGVAS
ncbi:MAG: protein phosphatase 2C domain-containing protein [Candidatus Nanopelagicales bacterium]|nr:protein phosphatase 2C domain-containing protein [Candidatus Nanopelagicales bacterium]